MKCDFCAKAFKSQSKLRAHTKNPTKACLQNQLQRQQSRVTSLEEQLAQEKLKETEQMSTIADRDRTIEKQREQIEQGEQRERKHDEVLAAKEAELAKLQRTCEDLRTKNDRFAKTTPCQTPGAKERKPTLEKSASPKTPEVKRHSGSLVARKDARLGNQMSTKPPVSRPGLSQCSTPQAFASRPKLLSTPQVPNRVPTKLNLIRGTHQGYPKVAPPSRNGKFARIQKDLEKKGLDEFITIPIAGKFIAELEAARKQKRLIDENKRLRQQIKQLELDRPAKRAKLSHFAVGVM